MPTLFYDNPIRFNAPAGHTVLAMITTAKAVQSPLEVPVKHPRAAGLPQNCFVRIKLFTLDNRLVVRSLGKLSEPDRKQVQENLRALNLS
jgi:PemK-like, MazF-like toxin of type II toxin-antitoxin system